jgi:hypothetical protein
MVPTGTENGGVRTSKQCVKHLTPEGKPHDGPHSLRVYAKVDTSTIKADALTLEAVPTSETVEGLTERTRDELQQKIDAYVLAAHKAWSEAGKLSGFNEVIKAGAGQRFFMAPNEVAAYRSLLRRAAAFHVANGIPIHVRVIPPKVHTDGRSMLYWIAVDKRELSDEAKAKAKAKREATAAKKAAADKAAADAKAKAEADAKAKAEADKRPTPAAPRR